MTAGTNAPFDPEELGSNLAWARWNAKLTGREVARRLDIDPSYLSHIEHGRRTPSLALLVRAARLLQVGVDQLLGGE